MAGDTEVAIKEADGVGFWDLLLTKPVQKRRIVKPPSTHGVDQGDGIRRAVENGSGETNWNLVQNFSQLMLTNRSDSIKHIPTEGLSIDLCLEYLYLSAPNLATVPEEQERLGERFYSWVLGDKNRICKFNATDIRRAELVDTFLLDLRTLQRLWSGESL